MNTNHRNILMQDDLEVDDLGKNRFNGMAMLFGLIVPIFVFAFLILRSGIEFFAKKLVSFVMYGSTSDAQRAAPSASTIAGR